MTKPHDKTGQNLTDPARQDPAATPGKAAEDKDKLKEEARQQKATQFDGNPNVEQAPDSAVGPKDDTPWKLKKKG